MLYCHPPILTKLPSITISTPMRVTQMICTAISGNLLSCPLRSLGNTLVCAEIAKHIVVSKKMSFSDTTRSIGVANENQELKPAL